jgi:hypothetical protein
MCAEFLHDGLQRRLVLLQQYAKLLVLVEQGLILNNELGILALELGFEEFCRLWLIAQFSIKRMDRTL